MLPITETMEEPWRMAKQSGWRWSKGSNMGFEFVHRKETVWSPSATVARCFLAQVRFLEQTVGAESGLEESMADTVEVDYTRLAAFLTNLRSRINLDNHALYALLRGTATLLIAILASRGPVPPEIANAFPAEWLIEAMSAPKWTPLTHLGGNKASG